jgi:hypothetical protein
VLPSRVHAENVVPRTSKISNIEHCNIATFHTATFHSFALDQQHLSQINNSKVWQVDRWRKPLLNVATRLSLCSQCWQSVARTDDSGFLLIKDIKEAHKSTRPHNLVRAAD